MRLALSHTTSGSMSVHGQHLPCMASNRVPVFLVEAARHFFRNSFASPARSVKIKDPPSESFSPLPLFTECVCSARQLFRFVCVFLSGSSRPCPVVASGAPQEYRIAFPLPHRILRGFCFFQDPSFRLNNIPNNPPPNPPPPPKTPPNQKNKKPPPIFFSIVFRARLVRYRVPSPELPPSRRPVFDRRTGPPMHAAS